MKADGKRTEALGVPMKTCPHGFMIPLVPEAGRCPICNPRASPLVKIVPRDPPEGGGEKVRSRRASYLRERAIARATKGTALEDEVLVDGEAA